MIKESEHGLNLNMITELAGMKGSNGWEKAEQILSKMVSEGKISERKIGQSRVFYVKHQIYDNKGAESNRSGSHQ